jgi:hypothetical protein
MSGGIGDYNQDRLQNSSHATEQEKSANAKPN